jgi:hypothetical protein
VHQRQAAVIAAIATSENFAPQLQVLNTVDAGGVEGAGDG